jgi:hypothetical protein
MARTIARFALVVVPAGLAALALGLASNNGAVGAGARRVTYFQDVKPILDGRCVGCHYRGGIAPFPLKSYAAARSHRIEMAAAVGLRLMPPWLAEPGHRRYLYDPSLTSAQIATIKHWVAAGAPKGDASRAAPSLKPVGPKLSRVDLRLRLPGPYTPQRRLGADDYRCFVVPWTADRVRYVTGFNVVPGERREVHHIIVFLAPPSDAARVDGWEAADRRPGYSCYGGPSATGRTDIAAQFLAGWVPGMLGTDLPAGTGVQILPGSRLIVQIHYNLATTKPRPDRSLVELKLDDSVAKRGIYVPIVDFRWLLDPTTMAIPAGKRHVVHSWVGDPRPTIRFFAPDLDLTRGFRIYAVIHHMHQLGKRGAIAVEHANGKRAVLLAIRRWNFHWQREYHLAQPEVFSPGDRLSIRCEWDNSGANQPSVRGQRRRPRLVTWGESTSDEMCIGFVYVTEL